MNIKKMLESFFEPTIKLAEHEGLLFPTDRESKAILKIYSGSAFIPSGQYDSLLMWLSKYGLGITVEPLA